MTIPMLSSSSKGQYEWPDTEIPDEWCRGIEILFEGGDVAGGLGALSDYCSPGFYPTNWQMHILLYLICHQPPVASSNPHFNTRTCGRPKATPRHPEPTTSSTQSKYQTAITINARSALALLRSMTAHLVHPYTCLSLSLPTPTRGSSSALTSYDVNPLYLLPTNAKEFVRRCTGGVWDMVLESETDVRKRVRREEWNIQAEERKRSREKEARLRKRQKEKKRKAKRDTDTSEDWDTHEGNRSRSRSRKKRKFSTMYGSSSDECSRSDSFDPADASEASESGAEEAEEEEEEEEVPKTFDENSDQEDGDDGGGEVVRAGCWGLVRWLVDLWAVRPNEASDGDGRDHQAPRLKALIDQLPISQHGMVTDISRPIAVIRSAMIPTLVADVSSSGESTTDQAKKNREQEKKCNRGQEGVNGKSKPRTRVESEKDEDGVGIGQKSEQEDEEGMDTLTPFVRVEMSNRRTIATSLIDSLFRLTKTRQKKLELTLLVSQLSNIALSVPVSFLAGSLEVMNLDDNSHSRKDFAIGIYTQAIRSICGLGRSTLKAGEGYGDVDRIKAALACRLQPGRIARSSTSPKELATDIRRLHMLKVKLIETIKQAQEPHTADSAGLNDEKVMKVGGAAFGGISAFFPTAIEMKDALWPFASEEGQLREGSDELLLIRSVKARVERSIEELAFARDAPKTDDGR